MYTYVCISMCIYVTVYLCMSTSIHPSMHACIHSFLRPSAYLPAYATATGDEFPPVFLRGLTNPRSSLHIASTISSRPPAWLLCQVGTLEHSTMIHQMFNMSTWCTHGAHLASSCSTQIQCEHNLCTTFAWEELFLCRNLAVTSHPNRNLLDRGFRLFSYRCLRGLLWPGHTSGSDKTIEKLDREPWQLGVRIVNS